MFFRFVLAPSANVGVGSPPLLGLQTFQRIGGSSRVDTFGLGIARKVPCFHVLSATGNEGPRLSGGILAISGNARARKVLVEWKGERTGTACRTDGF